MSWLQVFVILKGIFPLQGAIVKQLWTVLQHVIFKENVERDLLLALVKILPACTETHPESKNSVTGSDVGTQGQLSDELCSDKSHMYERFYCLGTNIIMTRGK